MIKPTFRFPTKFNTDMYNEDALNKYAGATHHDQCIMHVSAYIHIQQFFPCRPHIVSHHSAYSALVY